MDFFHDHYEKYKFSISKIEKLWTHHLTMPSLLIRSPTIELAYERPKKKNNNKKITCTHCRVNFGRSYRVVGGVRLQSQLPRMVRMSSLYMQIGVPHVFSGPVCVMCDIIHEDRWINAPNFEKVTEFRRNLISLIIDVAIMSTVCISMQNRTLIWY